MAEAVAYRIVDFSAGVVFGVRGSLERVTPRVFLLSPAQVNIKVEEPTKPARHTICSLIDRFSSFRIRRYIGIRPTPSKESADSYCAPSKLSCAVVSLSACFLSVSLIGRILAWLINAYITVLFVRMILDWVSVLARTGIHVVWWPS